VGTRNSLALLAQCGSIALSVWLAATAAQILWASDATLVARFEGAAYEDIFGFDFWRTWAIIATAQGVALGLGWLSLRTNAMRTRVLVLIAIFGLASAFAYAAFAHEQALWSSYTGK
jgi:hypothetical protein